MLVPLERRKKPPEEIAGDRSIWRPIAGFTSIDPRRSVERSRVLGVTAIRLPRDPLELAGSLLDLHELASALIALLEEPIRALQLGTTRHRTVPETFS